MNFGKSIASGDYLLYSNAGDGLLSLEVEQLDGDVVGFPVIIRSEEGYKKIRYPNDPCYLFPHHQGTFLRKSVYSVVDFNENFKYAGDLEYFHKIQDCKVSYMESPAVSEFVLGGASNRKGISFFIGKLERYKIIVRYSLYKVWINSIFRRIM